MKNNGFEEYNKEICPLCGSLMEHKSEYIGGTASTWQNTPVSSTGSLVIVHIYGEQKIYKCSNIVCGYSLLK